MKRFLLYFLFLLGLFLFLGCEKSEKVIQKAAPLKLGLLAIEDNLPFFVAENDGLFTKLGLKVELISFNSARERDIALEAGEIQGELADILAAALIKKGGTPVKIVSLGLGSTPQEGRFVILAAPGSNITEPSQLAGCPIAVSQHTIIHYLADEMLKEKGLSAGAVAMQNIPDLKVRLEALLSGADVKAALLPDPLAALAENSGARPIIDDTKLQANLSQTVILFREEVLQNRAAEVSKILQAYEEAAASLNANPPKYHQLIMDKARIPQPLEYSYQIPHFSQLSLPSAEMITRVIDWMVKKDLLAKPLHYTELVAPGYLGRR